jgi:hypothetical protein
MNPADPLARPSRKLLFVTDVPFWREQTGAQQRILSLIRHFLALGWPVTTCFLGARNEEIGKLAGLPNGVKTLASLDLVFLADDWSPSGWWDRILWQVQCTLHAISSFFSGPNKTGQPLKHSSGKRLAEFESPQFRRRVQHYVQRLKPDVVVVEYVTLAYLLPSPRERAGIEYWVDTHDLLSARCQQFKARGLSHWVEISETEEAQELKKFDGIIAIEPEEAATFRKFVPENIPVVVAQHAPTHLNRTLTKETATKPPLTLQDKLSPSRPMTIGMIASNNSINVSDLKWFLDEVWPRVMATCSEKKQVQLFLAGSICQMKYDFSRLQNVQTLGTIGSLEEFYERIDLVVNPVSFGTGLKIKSVEALCYGKPLLATNHGVEGIALPHSADSHSWPWIVANTAEAMAAAIITLGNNPAQLQQLSAASNFFAATYAGDAYRELTTLWQLGAR